MTKADGIPEGYHSVTPYLSVAGAADALAFYQKAFGASEVMRLEAPDGKIAHAEIEIGGSRIMISDEWPEMDFAGPKSRGGTTVCIHLYVPDSDALVAQAVAAGATVKEPVEDKFYGDRTGTVEDPFGHIWHIATNKEQLSEAELRRRAEAAMKAMAGGAG